ncbi:MAG: hypothetical protein C5B57_11420 [Blastocatellia bacterium]|nr:MAG: hypothetical protein C5B57_11420 [Blastocatellia bacterium]
MIRKMFRVVGVAALAIVAAGTIAEATPSSPKKVVGHRTRHSTRETVDYSTAQEQTVRKTRRRAAKKKTTASSTIALKRRTRTKPR